MGSCRFLVRVLELSSASSKSVRCLLLKKGEGGRVAPCDVGAVRTLSVPWCLLRARHCSKSCTDITLTTPLWLGDKQSKRVKSVNLGPTC